MRTWLYRIATTACLRALENRARRVLPAGPGRQLDRPGHQSGRKRSAPIDWLEPIPDALMFETPRRRRHRKAKCPAGRDDGPAGASGAAASRVDPARRRAVQRRRGCRTSRNHARRGQQLPAAGPGPSRRGLPHRRKRWSSPTTPSAVSCSTATARHSKTRTWPPSPRCCKPTSSSKCRPLPIWFTGRDTVMRFLAARAFTKAGDIVMIPTAANGQPAVAEYRRTADDVMRAHSIHVLTAPSAGAPRGSPPSPSFSIRRLFTAFGLPPSR